MKKNLDKFIFYLKYEKQYSSNTIEAYQRDLQNFYLILKAEGVNDWSEVTPYYIQSHVSDLHRKKLKRKSIQRKLASIRSLFNYLLREKKLTDNMLRLSRVRLLLFSFLLLF